MAHHKLPSQTWSVEEAAQLLGLSRSATYDLIYAGEIQSLRLGRRVRVPKATVEAMLGHAVRLNENIPA